MGWGMNSAVVDDRGNTVGAANGNERPERFRAVRTVASMSSTAVECAEVLAMLGLDPRDGKGAEEAA